MKTPKNNAKKILSLFEENDNSAKKYALNYCDGIIYALDDYNKSLRKLREQDEAEGLVLEKKIKFWLDTIEEIKNK